MESSPSSSSSAKHSTEENVNEKQKSMAMANQLVSNCLVVLPLAVPQFIHNPFISLSKPQPPICSFNKLPNIQSIVSSTTTHIIHNFHSSLLSTADNCIRFFHLFAFQCSQNPFFGKVFSISADFQNFCQIHRRNYRNLNSISCHNFAAILPGDSVAGVVVANGILNFLNIYNTLLVCRLVLTWFPNSPPAIVSPLSTLCDPYLNIFRGIIPPLGGTLDLSPILAFLVLNALTSTASALPAELPPEGVSKGVPSSCDGLLHLTTSQKKWMRRFTENRSKKPSNDN